MELPEINIKINITDDLKTALKIGEEWSYLLFFECMEMFKESELSVSYWKGEDDWMTLLNGNRIIAYIWRRCPLMFVDGKAIFAIKKIIDDKYRLVSISTSDLELDVFKIDEDFHLIDFDSGFDKMGFSAEDFWYYTNDSV
ncbi:hypothetical protein [Sphingobacterium sp. LRF_L2]|uniref:hypothetical protein n=1 Tax=Sphingobacterium sp. LRF_L2 TaxID=3369421 RepID=UPI003F60EBBA